MTPRSKAWIHTHLLSPRFGVYLVLLTPLLAWDRLFFGNASAKIFWMYAVTQVTFVAYLWFVYYHPSLQRKYPWQTWVFMGFLVVLTISTFVGVYPANSFWADYSRNAGLLTWLHLALLFPVLRYFFRTQADWQALARFSVCVGVIVSSIFFLTRWGLYTPIISDNGGSTLGNSSYLGVYLLFQMFFALMLTIPSCGKWTRIFGVSVFLFFVLTLLSTDARAASVAFIGAVVFAVGLFLMTKRTPIMRVVGGLLIGSLLIGFGYIAVFAYAPQSFLHKLVIEKATASRFVVADIALEAFKERPLLGWGPENFSYAFLAHYDPCFGSDVCGGNTIFDRAHNIVLDMLIQVGIFGLIGYLSLLVVSVYSVWRLACEKKIDQKLAILFTATIAAYFIQNLTFLDELNSLLFLIFLFSLPITLMSRPTAQKTSLSLPLVPAFATVLFPITFFLFVIQPLHAGLAVFSATTATDSLIRYAAYEVATEVSPFGRDVRREYLGFSTAKLLWSFRPIEDAKKLEVQSTYLEQEAALIERALYDTIDTSPNNFRSYLYLIQLLHAHARLFDKNKFAEAMIVAEEAIARNSMSPRLYWIKVAILLEQGDTQTASETARFARALNMDTDRSKWNTFLFATYIEDVALQQDMILQLLDSDPFFARRIEEVLALNLQSSEYTLLYELYSE